MQNIPCEVLAYRRFSIFRLQLRHRKQVAQKAWSPVRMARSSILLPQALQLYVQLLQMSEPSPRSSKFASESRSVPQVLQRKQLRCHRLPATSTSSAPSSGTLGTVKRDVIAQDKGTSGWGGQRPVETLLGADLGIEEALVYGDLPSSNALPSSSI